MRLEAKGEVRRLSTQLCNIIERSKSVLLLWFSLFWYVLMSMFVVSVSFVCVVLYLVKFGKLSDSLWENSC